MALQTLSIDLEAKLARFTADMGQAARVSERTAAQISSGFNAIKTAAGGLVAGLSVGFFVQLTRNAIDSIDALNDVKDATGASIENLSALEDIAARTGTRFETVGDTLSKFNKRLVDAKPGTDVAQAFDALGLSLEELKRLDPAEALQRTAVALAGFADDGRKARLQTVIFSDAVKNIAPFMKNLGEAGTLVAKVTTQQAEEAEKFNRELLALQKNADDLTRTLASGLVKALNDTATEFRAATRDGKSFLEVLASRYWSNVRGFYESLGIVGPANTGGATGSFASAGGGRGFVNPATVRPSVAEIVPVDKPTNPKVAKDVDLTNKSYEGYIKTLTLTLERTQDLSEAEKALAFLRREGAGVSIDDAARVISLARQVDALRDAEKAERDLAQTERELAAIRVSAEQLSTRRLDGLIADTDAMVRNNEALRQQLEELGLSVEALERLRVARLDDAIAAERQRLVNAQSVEGNEAEIALIERRIRLKEIERGLTTAGADKRRQVDLEAESADAARILNNDVKNALSNAFRDSRNPILAFGEALGNVVYTRLTNAAANGLADILVGTGKPGGSGGLLSGLVGLFGGFFAGGGDPPLGKASIVGERGPEWFIPRQAGTIVPAGKMGGGGTTVIYMTPQIGDVASMSYVQAAVQRGVQAALGMANRQESYT